MVKPVLKKPDIIVFDLDGTLTQNGRVGRFIAARAEKPALFFLRILHSAYEKARKVKNKYMPKISLQPPFKKKLLHMVCKPRPEIAEMTADLKQRGIKTVLLSNNARIAWYERLARYFDFGEGFDKTVFGEDTGKRLKPNAGPLIDAINKMSRGKPMTVWMIGDMASDMQAADAAHQSTHHLIIPIAMGRKSRAAQTLKQHFNTSVLVVESCTDITEKIAQSRKYTRHK